MSTYLRNIIFAIIGVFLLKISIADPMRATKEVSRPFSSGASVFQKAS
jgi:hypothetical protein